MICQRSLTCAIPATAAVAVVITIITTVAVIVRAIECSTAVSVITLATIFHGIAQELSDFLVLTDPMQGGLKAGTALLLNALSGLSVLLGTILVFSLETVNDPMVGMLLAFGGGVYVQIGAAECMPRVFALADTIKLRACCLTAFAVGATAIGLVLLDHQHCSAGGGGHAHAH